jgi:hypothetical protein
MMVTAGIAVTSWETSQSKGKVFNEEVLIHFLIQKILVRF